jgi:hypothetical protein
MKTCALSKLLCSVIFALAFANASTSQAVTSTLYVTDAGNHSLYTLSTDDTTTALVGRFGVGGHMEQLALLDPTGIGNEAAVREQSARTPTRRGEPQPTRRKPCTGTCP